MSYQSLTLSPTVIFNPKLQILTSVFKSSSLTFPAILNPCHCFGGVIQYFPCLCKRDTQKTSLIKSFRVYTARDVVQKNAAREKTRAEHIVLKTTLRPIRLGTEYRETWMKADRKEVGCWIGVECSDES